jgi:hypothetical protein
LETSAKITPGAIITTKTMRAANCQRVSFFIRIPPLGMPSFPKADFPKQKRAAQ